MAGENWHKPVFIMASAELLTQASRRYMDALRSPVPNDAVTRYFHEPDDPRFDFTAWDESCHRAKELASQHDIPTSIADAFSPNGPGRWCAARGAGWATLLADRIAPHSVFRYEDYLRLMHPYRAVAVPQLANLLGDALPLVPSQSRHGDVRQSRLLALTEAFPSAASELGLSGQFFRDRSHAAVVAAVPPGERDFFEWSEKAAPVDRATP